jgi:hypothetical protein
MRGGKAKKEKAKGRNQRGTGWKAFTIKIFDGQCPAYYFSQSDFL